VATRVVNKRLLKSFTKDVAKAATRVATKVVNKVATKAATKAVTKVETKEEIKVIIKAETKATTKMETRAAIVVAVDPRVAVAVVAVDGTETGKVAEEPLKTHLPTQQQKILPFRPIPNNTNPQLLLKTSGKNNNHHRNKNPNKTNGKITLNKTTAPTRTITLTQTTKSHKPKLNP